MNSLKSFFLSLVILAFVFSCKSPQGNTNKLNYYVVNDTSINGEFWSILSTFYISNGNWNTRIADTIITNNFPSKESFFLDSINHNLIYFSQNKRLYKIDTDNGNILYASAPDLFYWGKNVSRTTPTNVRVVEDYIIVSTLYDVVFFDSSLNYLCSIGDKIHTKKNERGLILPSSSVRKIEVLDYHQPLQVKIHYKFNDDKALKSKIFLIHVPPNYDKFKEYSFKEISDFWSNP